jgi:hypothetical protein
MPVNRIVVDEELVKDLHEQRHGLTVTRCEPHRHSFLDPLRGLGAEFFWVWPVLARDRVAAILSVGYLGVPSVPPEIAAYGTESAARSVWRCRTAPATKSSIARPTTTH